jgi:polysaccharide pyruvyl transferase WcaK-like protein
MTYRDIVVVGYYGYSNFGDDILSNYVLSQVCQAVSPERVSVSAPRNTYLEEWFPGIQCLPRHMLLQSHVDGAQKLVFGGGGLFHSFPPATPYNLWGLSSSSTYRFLRTLKLAGLRKARKYAFCVGVGPMVGRGGRWITRQFLRRFEQLSVRDSVSKHILLQLGIRSARLVADPSIDMVQSLPPNPQRDPKAIGIVVRAWPYTADTTNLSMTLQAAAAQLRYRGWKVQFISFQPRPDQLLLNANEDVRMWNPQQETIADFCRYLSRHTALVTMRAHGIYLAAMMGSIPLAINIEPKLPIAAARCGYLHNVISMDSSAETLVARIEQAIEQGPAALDWQADLAALEQEARRLRTWLQTG